MTIAEELGTVNDDHARHKSEEAERKETLTEILQQLLSRKLSQNIKNRIHISPATVL